MSKQPLRTPEHRFMDLPDYPFKPNYHEVDGLRMHYVDEGDKRGQVVLMMHGEPSWSYLYRHMIPLCVAAGHRVIAPDLIGFGKSDKLPAIADYSYQRHVDWVKSLITELQLTNITLVCQDWGSLIGLRIAAELEPLFPGLWWVMGFCLREIRIFLWHLQFGKPLRSIAPGFRLVKLSTWEAVVN